MRIGIQTSGILDVRGIEKGFELIRDTGFDCVDFNLDPYLSYGDIVSGRLESVFTRPLDELIGFFSPFKQAAERNHVAIGQMHAPFPSYVKDSPVTNYQLLEIFKNCIALCEHMDCPRLIIHPFFLGYQDKLGLEQEFALNMESYAALIPSLQKHNVVVCLENMFSEYRGKIYSACCSDMHDALRYVDELNERAGRRSFGFCLDTGHALLLGLDIEDIILKLGDRLEALHIHDNNGLTDQHIAPYMGILDWDRFVRGLKAIGYKRDLSFESANALRMFDAELMPQVLALTAATGRMFARRIEE